MRYSAILLIFLLIAACSDTPQSVTRAPMGNATPGFSAYWNKGLAELNAYDLIQTRYGEQRQGEAVLIFVTENFLAGKQVKSEGAQTGPSVIPVMKMNFTKKFITGIYPYSMMSSVFSPVSGAAPAIKITTSSQEWCGHTFTQLNLRDERYQTQLYSYFEAEADTQLAMSQGVVAEDGIWNIIRLLPEQLPIGEVAMIPGTMYQRLSHNAIWMDTATCSLTEMNFGKMGPVNCYSVSYKNVPRELDIYFEKAFPYKIVGWIEKERLRDTVVISATATLRKSIQLDYWKHNKPSDTTFRDSLGIIY